MNPHTIWRPKPDVRLGYHSDAHHRGGASAVYVQPSARSASSKPHKASSASRGYASDSSHARGTAFYDPPTTTASSSHTRHRVDPSAAAQAAAQASYSYPQPSSSKTPNPTHASAGPSRVHHHQYHQYYQQPPPSHYDPRLYGQRAYAPMDRTPMPTTTHTATMAPTATTNSSMPVGVAASATHHHHHHARTAHDDTRSTRHRARDHPAPPVTSAPSSSHASTDPHRLKRSKRHAEDIQRIAAREAEQRRAAEAADRARIEAEERARLEAERAEAERAKEKALARARRKELKAQQEEAARRELELEIAVKRRREEKREEKRREKELQEMERLKLQPSTSKDSRERAQQNVSSKETTRAGRIKDSDDSDNSLLKRPSIRKHKHQRNASAPVVPVHAGSSPGQQSVQVPVVASSQASYPRQYAVQGDGGPSSSGDTLRQPPVVSHRPKHHKNAWSYNDVAPYPPGYAVSGSDSEHTMRKETRTKKQDRMRPYAVDNIQPVPVTQSTAPLVTEPSAVPMSRTESRGSTKTRTLGGMANWLLKRSTSKDKRSPKAVVVPPANGSPHVVNAPSVPAQAVSITAGEGPADQSTDYTRQRTVSSSGQAQPIDPRKVQTQSSQLPEHVQALMQAHETSQSYPKPLQQPVDIRTPFHPPVSPAPPVRPSIPGQSSIYQNSSFNGSASHVATFAPSLSLPSPQPAPVNIASYRPPSPNRTPLARSPSTDPYGKSSALPTGHRVLDSSPTPRVGANAYTQPDRMQPAPAPAPSIRQRSSPPRAVDNLVASHSGRAEVTPGRRGGNGSQESTPKAKQIEATMPGAFPILEDSPGRGAHRQHARKPSSAELYARSKEREDQRGLSAAQQIANAYSADNRQNRPTTKTSSPGQQSAIVTQNNTPPKTAIQPIPSPHVISSPIPSPMPAHDSSRPHVPVAPQPLTYPDTIVYPPTANRLDASYNATSNNNASYNSSRANPSPKSHNNPILQSQSAAAAAITTRTASYDTGSTTLVGHTPTFQTSAIPPPTSTTVAVGTGAATQAYRNHTVPTPANSNSSARQTNARYHSSPPVAQTMVSTQTAGSSPGSMKQTIYPTYSNPVVVPVPARSYSSTHATVDLRNSPAGHIPPPIRVPSRQMTDSPDDDDDLNTPSSLVSSPKFEIYSNPIHPVTTTQSLPEGKRKASFLDRFRMKSSSKTHNEHILHPQSHDHRMRQPSSAHRLGSKVPLSSESDGPAKLLKKRPTLVKSAPTPAPVTAPIAVPAYPTPPKGATLFRVLSKRHRTMSGASAEAVDGTNAGTSTIVTSPATSLRSTTPRLIPPRRDPAQATQDWRNAAEADEIGRGSARRRRPGVTFEGYAEDHPQAENHTISYVKRAHRQPIPQQMMHG